MNRNEWSRQTAFLWAIVSSICVIVAIAIDPLFFGPATAAGLFALQEER